jgi:hypothetical protein
VLIAGRPKPIESSTRRKAGRTLSRRSPGVLFPPASSAICVSFPLAAAAFALERLPQAWGQRGDVHGELEVSDAKRLKALEIEKVKLEKMLAESMLDNAALRRLRKS